MTQLVIAVAMDNFTFAFNIVEAFVCCGANLMSGRTIIIMLKQVSVNKIPFGFLGDGWWN